MVHTDSCTLESQLPLQRITLIIIRHLLLIVTNPTTLVSDQQQVYVCEHVTIKMKLNLLILLLT